LTEESWSHSCIHRACHFETPLGQPSSARTRAGYHGSDDRVHTIRIRFSETRDLRKVRSKSFWFCCKNFAHFHKKSACALRNTSFTLISYTIRHPTVDLWG